MSLIDCKCILLTLKSSGVNLPTYDISLIDSCKLLLSSGKVLQCVLQHSVDSWRVIIFNLWDDNSAYTRSVMLCGCFLTYHFIDGFILSFSM